MNDWVRQDHRFHDWLDLNRERHASYAEKGDPGDLLGGTGSRKGWNGRGNADCRAKSSAFHHGQQAATTGGYPTHQDSPTK
ncbi:hypothetical protein, partial [Streptomyces echinatus]|uniref:hypothetical protein n=1 Tax=Streptomyces echinatus TaxID=67293 RepID=UPI0031EE2CDB